MRKIIIAFAFCSILFTHCFAQWEPDMRLTIDPASSFTCYNQTKSVSASGDSLNVVWYDNRDGNYEIYYKRSSNSGISWSTDTRLTNNPASSQYPSVSSIGPVIHIVWQDNRDGNNEIYYKRSTDAGLNWGSDIRLTNNSFEQTDPTLSVSGQVVHIAWRDMRDGNAEVYYKRSTDGGTSWEIDTRLTNDPAILWFPSISSLSTSVIVVWEEYRDGNAEIYCKRSTDGGESWGLDTRLTNNPLQSSRPNISLSGSLVHLVWYDLRDGGREIYYKRSTDGGNTWEADTRLTNISANKWDPSIAVLNTNVHLVWFDYRDGIYPEIYYKNSTDGGTSWGADTRLINNTAGSSRPSIAVVKSNVHVVWIDNRDGNDEIYYKRNPTGSIVGLKNIFSETPKEFSLSQNYPNPFNPSTIIKYQLPNTNFVRLAVYDIAGKEIAVLVNGSQRSGVYEVEFDGSNQPSGVYFCRMQADNFTEVKKLMLIK